jgi:ureidoacrylate peracid hydrolase
VTFDPDLATFASLKTGAIRMHTIQIAPEVIARVTQRRGGLHLYDHVIGPRTAHVVVDLQNGFMVPGQIAEITTAREIVPNVNRISTALRAAGGLVIYIQNTFDAEAIAGWDNFFDFFCSPERRPLMIEAFTPGNFGHEVYAGLEVLEGDVKLRKRRYGAFVPGASELHALLQARGIDTLIVTGTATNVCCESTARDAMMLNYKVLFVADGNATHTDVEHNATLSAMANAYADVVTTEETVTLIAAGSRVAAAAE